MKLSNARMPRWWQSLWRRRYACGVNGYIKVVVRPGYWYWIRPMGCGCGYRVFHQADEVTQLGGHCPTLRVAFRRIRRHSR